MLDSLDWRDWVSGRPAIYAVRNTPTKPVIFRMRIAVSVTPPSRIQTSSVSTALSFLSQLRFRFCFASASRKMAENHNADAAKQEEWLRALEEEVTSVLEQIGVSSKRNVVELFVSLKNKVFLCGRYHYLLKLLVGSTETFIKKRRIELKEEFDRDDYLGAADMKDKFAETNVMRRMNQKFQLVREFIDVNGAVFD